MKKRCFPLSRWVALLIALTLVLIPIGVHANGSRNISFYFQDGAGNPNVYWTQMIPPAPIQILEGNNPVVPRGYEARRGFYFAGWYKGIYPDWIPLHPHEYVVTDYDRTFTARFNLLYWYIVFYVEEGGVEDGRTYYRERDGRRLIPNLYTRQPTIPDTTPRPGYAFTGWYAIDAYGDRERVGECLITVLGGEHPILNVTVDLTGNYTFVATFEPLLEIEKDFSRELSKLVPGGTVEYILTITIDERMCPDVFHDYVRVIDNLHPSLTLDTGSISIAGASAWDFATYSTPSRLEIHNIEWDGTSSEVVITFTATIDTYAMAGESIPNVARLYADEREMDRAQVEFSVGDEIDLEVEKIWIGDTPSNRPEYITVELLRRINEEEPWTETGLTINLNAQRVNAQGNWIGVFERLLKVDANGNEIFYSIKELNVPDGYDSAEGVATEKNPDDGDCNLWIITLTNTLIEPDGGRTATLTINKVWAGDQDHLSHRPATIQVEIRMQGLDTPLETLLLSAANGWTQQRTIQYLEKAPLLYIVELNVPTGYRATGGNLTGNPTDGFVATITNTFTPPPDDPPPHGNGGNGGNGNGPLTGDLASFVPMLAGLLFAMSSVLGGTSLKRRFRRK